MPLMTRCLAELIGTCWLVLGGVGAAVLAGPQIGVAGIAAAFGLALLTGAYVLGPISGAHFNPAVTLGFAAAGRLAPRDAPSYILCQMIGAVVAALIVMALAPDGGGSLGSNGYGAHSPGGFPLLSGALAELVFTTAFVALILSVTNRPALAPIAPLAIGLALTLIHLVSIPITGTSVNPARSFGPALIAGGWPFGQVWLFLVVPLIGGCLAGLVGRIGVLSPLPPPPPETLP